MKKRSSSEADSFSASQLIPADSSSASQLIPAVLCYAPDDVA